MGVPVPCSPPCRRVRRPDATSFTFFTDRTLAARGETPASHRDERGAPIARRDDREYREYSREEQRRERGCIARRMQRGFHHGLLRFDRPALEPSSCLGSADVRREEEGMPARTFPRRSIESLKNEADGHYARLIES